MGGEVFVFVLYLVYTTTEESLDVFWNDTAGIRVATRSS